MRNTGAALSVMRPHARVKMLQRKMLLKGYVPRMWTSMPIKSDLSSQFFLSKVIGDTSTVTSWALRVVISRVRFVEARKNAACATAQTSSSTRRQSRG